MGRSTQLDSRPSEMRQGHRVPSNTYNDEETFSLVPMWDQEH